MPLWFWLAIVIILSCLFCWYLSPDRNAQATRTQKIVATVWIILRRVVSFAGAAFGGLCLYILWETADSTTEKLIGSILISCLSAFFVYVGVVGQGWNQFGFNDDLSLYKKVKKKYGIRW